MQDRIWFPRLTSTPSNLLKTGCSSMKKPANKSPVSHALSTYRCYLPVLAGFSGVHSTESVGWKKNSEREGFEPSIPLLVYTPSKGAPSTTRTPLHGRSIALHEKIRGIGERGIRTLGTGKPVHWISSPAPSTTRTSLQAINLYMRLRRFELPTLSSANWYSIQLSYSLIM